MTEQGKDLHSQYNYQARHNPLADYHASQEARTAGSCSTAAAADSSDCIVCEEREAPSAIQRKGLSCGSVLNNKGVYWRHMALAVYGMFIPRIVIVFLYLFSGWFVSVFANGWWLLAGAVFLPCTTLWYSAVFNWYGGTWDAWQTSVFIGALIVDVSLLVRGKSA